MIDIRGKTDNASLHPHLVANINALITPHIEALYLDFPEGACLYGEGYGAGIQEGGGRYREEKDFVLFDVFGGKGRNYFKREAVEEIGAKYGLDFVPIIGRGNLWDMVEMVRNGFLSKWGPFEAEGIVARPLVELQDRFGNRVITKIKHKDF